MSRSVAAQDVSVRTVPADELPAWFSTLHAAFGVTTRSDRAEAALWGPQLAPGRVWGAFAGPRMVGTLRSFPTQVSLPGGGACPADAAAAGSVLSSHRGRGVLRTLMRQHLEAAADREETISTLMTSAYPLHRSVGYGPATEQTSLRVAAGGVDFHADQRQDGAVAEVPPRDAMVWAAQVDGRCSTRRAGAIDRPGLYYRLAFDPPPVPGRSAAGIRTAVHRVGDTAHGFVRFHHESVDGQPRLVVDELLGSSARSDAMLWRFVLEQSELAEIVAPNRPVDDALPLLLRDARRVSQADRVDQLWLRVLRPDRLLPERRYSCTDGIVLDLVDDTGPAAGRYELQVTPQGAECRRVRTTADLRMPIATLSSLVLGGYSADKLARGGLLDEGVVGGVEKADRIFWTSRPPWCPFLF